MDNSRQAEADQLLEQSKKLFDSFQLEGTLPLLQQALTIYREVGASQEEKKALHLLRDVLRNKGNAYISGYMSGNNCPFIAEYLQVCEIIRLKVDKLEPCDLCKVGRAYEELEDHTKAIEYFEQGMTIARKVGNRYMERCTLFNLGNSYRALEDYAKAIDYYQQSLDIAREMSEHSNEGGTLVNVGLTYSCQGNNDMAIECMEQGWVILRDSGGCRCNQMQPLRYLGDAYASVGDYAKAIDYYQQSLAIARQLGNPQEEEAVLSILDKALEDYATTIE